MLFFNVRNFYAVHIKLKGQRHRFRNDLAKYMQILMLPTDADVATGFQYTVRNSHQALVQNASSNMYAETKWKAIKCTMESKVFDIHMCPIESHWFIGGYSVPVMIFNAAFSFQLKTKVICLHFLIPFYCNSKTRLYVERYQLCCQFSFNIHLNFIAAMRSHCVLSVDTFVPLQFEYAKSFFKNDFIHAPQLALY